MNTEEVTPDDLIIETEEIEAEPEVYSNWDQTLGFLFSPMFGWICVVIAVLIALSWNKIHNFLDKLYENKQRREYDAKCHKDPDWVMNHHQQMDIARRRMQDMYNVQAAAYQIKQAEKEKQKNLDKLLKYTSSEGNRLGSDASQRPEYSPLNGDAGGRYRPEKRSKCPGGGCK